ncbi:MAG: hypothetical protein K8R40_06940, partial [Anaerolineaceae bacterium]|nr:hypothetical protein [Anaerolineaceae bacterium]
MSKKSLFFIFTAILVFAFLLTACGDGSTEEGGFQIPAIKKDKFNVAMILIGPHDDGGWSQAHYEGLLYMEENMSDMHTA